MTTIQHAPMPPEARVGQRPSTAHWLVLLAGLILAAGVIRLLCFAGLGTSDCLRYINAAADLGRGHYPWASDPAVYTRPGFLLPLCPLVMVGGYTSWLPNMYPLACGLGLVLLTYWIGAQLAGRAAGLWAGFAIAFSTLAILTATGIVPDTPLTFWSTLAIALVLRAKDDVPRKKTLLLCLAAGAALGIAWTTKVAVVFVLPVVLVLVCRMKGRRAWALLGGMAGFILVLALEAGFWAAVSGDPLTRFRYLTGAIATARTSAGPRPPRASLWQYPLKMFVIISQDGLFYYFLVPAIVWALWREGRRLWMPLLWAVVVFACLQFGSGSLSQYRPLAHNPRYLMLLVPAGAVLIGAWLSSLSVKWRWTTYGLCLLYTSASGFLAWMDPATSRTDIEVAKASVSYLRQRGAAEVFSDRKFARYINYVRRDYRDAPPPAQVWLQDDLKPTEDLRKHPGAFVVRYDTSLRRLYATKGRYGKLPIDSAYTWLEKHADSDVVESRFGRPQRAALAGVWWVLKRLPFPGSIERRLNSAFSRHLSPAAVTVYQVPNRHAVSETAKPDSASVESCMANEPSASNRAPISRETTVEATHRLRRNQEAVKPAVIMPARNQQATIEEPIRLSRRAERDLWAAQTAQAGGPVNGPAVTPSNARGYAVGRRW